MKLNSLLTAIGFCFLGVVYAQDLSIVVNKKGRVGFSDSNGKEVTKVSHTYEAWLQLILSPYSLLWERAFVL